METITVKETSGPNANGWYEVVLEDGRKASTKNEAIATAAFQSRGTPVEAVIGVGQAKGSFPPNLYLNQLGDVTDTKAPKRNGKTASSIPATSTGEQERQKRIAAQWAFGRAVELFVGSGVEFTVPLSDAAKQVVRETADWLLESTS